MCSAAAESELLTEYSALSVHSGTLLPERDGTVIIQYSYVQREHPVRAPRPARPRTRSARLLAPDGGLLHATERRAFGAGGIAPSGCQTRGHPILRTARMDVYTLVYGKCSTQYALRPARRGVGDPALGPTAWTIHCAFATLDDHARHDVHDSSV